MIRSLTILVASYGFTVARSSTTTIARLGREAAAGNLEAERHFTQTGYARVLGVRNSDLGMVYYGVIALSVLTGLDRIPVVRRGLQLASLSATGVSVYLLWALFFRLHVWCSACMRGHVVNAALLALLWRTRTR
jgi:uncharacterized membrane protein